MQRADHWRLRTRTLALPRRPLVMGILNVTPDSFSDGGQHFDTVAAIKLGILHPCIGSPRFGNRPRWRW